MSHYINDINNVIYENMYDIPDSRNQRNISEVAFSPDGTLFAVGFQSGLIEVRKTTSNNTLATLEGHENYIIGLAFSPDGTRLTSAAADQTMRVWGIPPQ